MSKIIEITVRDKIAQTEFEEVVSFNSIYRLKFRFDEEWEAFPNRVAVVKWAGGAAELLFSGLECELPCIDSQNSEYAFIGVYSINEGQRIASSFVRVRCRAGACGVPAHKSVDSLHEQILDRLNQGAGGSIDGSLYIGDKTYNGSKDVTVTANDLNLARVAISGSYNDLSDKPAIGAGGAGGAVTSVNGQTGDVMISKNDLGLAKVAISGSWNDLTDKPSLDTAVTSVNGQTGDVMISKNDLGLAKIAISGSWNDLTDKPNLDSKVNSVNGQTGDVVISKSDLGLAQVAISGSWNDLADKPNLDSTVNSVNGQTGEVMISKSDLGLGRVLNERQMPVYGVFDGGNLNSFTDMGFYHVRGMANAVLTNAPTSTNNASGSDARWCVMVLNQDEDNLVVQVAFSEREDCAVRIRRAASGSWGAWKTII